MAKLKKVGNGGETSTANLGFADGTEARAAGHGGPDRGLEAKLWAAADVLRNNMDAAEYKHVFLGLIFLKYISDAFADGNEARAARHGWRVCGFEAKHAELEADPGSVGAETAKLDAAAIAANYAISPTSSLEAGTRDRHCLCLVSK